jgi:alkaline phosphatase D
MSKPGKSEMTRKITRRQALLGVSSSLLLPAACSQAPTQSGRQQSEVFAHGVASGDPDQTSVVIWTRVSQSENTANVDWLVATDAGFSDVVSKGSSTTDGNRDYTVKVVVEGLSPGSEFFYKFLVGGTVSPVGRTRTLADGHLDKLVLAVATCSNFPFGYFNAYEVIANDPSVDLVVHLGDYIYEYGQNGYGGETGKRIGRNHEPSHEIVSLADYRKRHAQYKTDQGSLALHASHPLIVIWDDHETANNPWMGGAANHQENEGDWTARKKASMQAYYEWLPIREPEAGNSREQYWRHYKFGDLASLITLESRHTGRSQQISYGDHRQELQSAEHAQEFLKTVVGAPDRNMLSPEMEGFLADELTESVDAGRAWRIIASPSVMAKSIAPPLDDSFFAKLRNGLDDGGTETLDDLTFLGNLGVPDDLDSWDGYPAARERFYQISKDAGARDLLVIAGDSHSYWANSLYDDNGNSMGLELGATGISSPRGRLDLGIAGLEHYDKLNAAHNKEIVWTAGQYRGFIRLEISHDGAHADFVTVSDVESRTYEMKIVHTVDIKNSNGTLRYV